MGGNNVHPLLGTIVQDADSGEATASVQYNNRSIEIRIDPDEFTYDEALAVAASTVQNLGELDIRAKRVAARDLLEIYNDGWNEYDEVQPDGTVNSVCNPELTPDDFKKKLHLTGVNVRGKMLVFFYDNEEMFWGHSVVVQVADGLNFRDAYAELFG